MQNIYPRINLSGNRMLRRVGVIYSQILNDLIMKVDNGEGDYPKGYFHTSTTPFSEPNYYNQMWSRDVGRGITELCRAGFYELSKSAVDYILSMGLTCGDHYGRLMHWETPTGGYETDGNDYMLTAFYNFWLICENKDEYAGKFLGIADSIFGWFKDMAEKSPVGYLLGSQSELSGNPEFGTVIYAVYCTYGAVGVIKSYIQMAKSIGDNQRVAQYTELCENLKKGLADNLISKGDGYSKAPENVWINGKNTDGTAAETGNFGPEFPIHRWTRQLPFVLDCDREGWLSDGDFKDVNTSSYEYIKSGMNEGYYFRKYGFVSCTCFSGMGGRHDDTMAGYGQNLFTQAALYSDDVNVYTKCIEGICRLAYDGDIVAPMTFELNPWVMHECFTYENYEQGLDHTFGRYEDAPKQIMYNPGDEGNLVQSAETLKSLWLMAGITSDGETLNISPRLPWECERAQVQNFAVRNGEKTEYISYDYSLERWQNKYTITVKGVKDFQKVDVRLGPLPNVLCNEKQLKEQGFEITHCHNASFASKTVKPMGDDVITLEMINEL